MPRRYCSLLGFLVYKIEFIGFLRKLRSFVPNFANLRMYLTMHFCKYCFLSFKNIVALKSLIAEQVKEEAFKWHPPALNLYALNPIYRLDL